jgi:alpha-amylase
MTRPVQLLLVIHNHQPVGNFDHVFEEACERAYLPFLRTLLEFPAVRIGLHTSGCLWEWLEEHRMDYGELVDELQGRGQVELLGGGMYEPILPVLSEHDAELQINRLSRFLRERFGVEISGAWIPERVWEPQLAATLANCDIRYCLLDDFHFEGNAPSATIATDYFVTEHAASEVAVFPISKELRYAIPFKPPQDTLDYLRELGEKTPYTPLAVFGDDGEKFGIWPDTYDWVYEKCWLRQFFQALSENAEWLKMMLPSEVLEQRQPADVVFIPSRSYFEMGEWTRVDGDGQPGHWRNFLNKYPESRQMYERVAQLSKALEVQGEVDSDVLDDLLRAECNCSYWHGVFGGIYLNYLRAATTRHLLRAERAVQWKDGEPASKNTLRNGQLSVRYNPEHGLSVSRLDYYHTLFNWFDVLARRREEYHGQLREADHEPSHSEGSASIHDIVRVKEPGLERRLVVDPHPRHSFVTYFSTATSPEDFLFATDDPPQIQHLDWHILGGGLEKRPNLVRATVQHDGFTLKKTLGLEESQLTCELKAEGDVTDRAGLFFVECNLTVLTDQADDRYMVVDGERRKLSKGVDALEVAHVALVDEWQQRRAVIETSPPGKLISYPVYTVSSSEGGFERTYQGTCIMLGFSPQTLTKGISVTLRIEEL